MSEKIKKQIIGRLEYIDFLDFNFFHVKAKLDSGAFHGAIHTSQVKEEKIDNYNVLSFFLLDPEHKDYTGEKIIVTNFRKVKITSSNNISEVRYVIPVRFQLGGQVFTSDFSLASRIGRKVPVLIGRENIRDYFIIDVSQTFIFK